MIETRGLSTIEEETERTSSTWSGSSCSEESTGTRSKILLGTKMEKAVKACQSGNLEMLKCMLNMSHITVNQFDDEGCTLLHWAAINNKIEIIHFLLAQGANVNMVGGNLKSTPLHWACHVAHLEAVVALLMNGADATIRNTHGETALHVAAQTGNSIIIAYLLIKCDRIKDIRDKTGQSALMIASRECYGMFPIKIFVYRRAHLDFADDAKGNTALHHAIKKQNHLGAVELMVGGADDEKRNHTGNTAMDMTSTRAAKELKELMNYTYLRRYGDWKQRLFSKWGAEMALSGGIIAFTILISFLFYHFVHIFAGLICLASMSLFIFAIYHQRSIQQMQLLPVSYIQTLGVVQFGILIFYTNGIIPWYLLLPTCLLWVISTTVFYILIFWNPGVVAYPEHPYDDFVQRIENGSKERYCFTCWVPRPPNSHHCSICDRCVHNFDHHCPWVYKCIYRQNMKLFLTFLVLAFVCCYIYSFLLGYCVYHTVSTTGLLNTLMNSTIIVVSFIFSILHIGASTTILVSQLLQISRIPSNPNDLATNPNSVGISPTQRIKNIYSYFVNTPNSSTETFSSTATALTISRTETY